MTPKKTFGPRWRMEYLRTRARVAHHEPGIQLEVRDRHDKPITVLEKGTVVQLRPKKEAST